MIKHPNTELARGENKTSIYKAMDNDDEQLTP